MSIMLKIRWDIAAGREADFREREGRAPLCATITRASSATTSTTPRPG